MKVIEDMICDRWNYIDIASSDRLHLACAVQEPARFLDYNWILKKNIKTALWYNVVVSIHLWTTIIYKCFFILSISNIAH